MSTSGPMLALPSAERPRARNLLNLGVLVGVCGGLMGFGALIAAYVNVRHFNHPWPPKGVKIENYPGTMLSLTMLLSAVTIEWAAFAARRRERSQAMAAIAITMGFGLAFLNLLWFFGRRAGFGPGTGSPFHVLFYALLTASGVAAGVGIVALAGVLARVAGRQAEGPDAEVVRAAGWYWQFVVVSWIAVYATLWL